MKKTLTFIGCSLFVATLLVSCDKNEISDEISTVENAETTATEKGINGSKSIWFSYNTDGAYTNSRWNSDFGNQGAGGTVDSYEMKRLRIVSNALRITSYKNTYGNASGIWAKVQIQPSVRYTLQYHVKFGSGFKWAKGGKLPGLSGGKNYSGCTGNTLKSKKDGWSFRPMWHQWWNTDSNTPYIDSYAYHEKMPSNCGDSFNHKRQSIKINEWHKVYIDIKMNSAWNKDDGRLNFKVDDKLVIYKSDMKWSSAWSGRQITNLMFDVYRGGGSDYKSPTTDYIYIDSIKLKKLSQ